MTIAAGQSQHKTTTPCDALQRVGNHTQAQNFITSIQVREQTKVPISDPPREQKARYLFADILGKPIDPNSHDYISTVTSHLDNILIEQQDGDITRGLQKFFGSSSLEVTIQLLRYSIYLSSNNLLSEQKTDMLLNWVIQSGQFVAIEHIIRLKTATTEIFASNILLSAIRIGCSSTVRALIALGTDVNIPGGCYPKDLALMTAARYLLKGCDWRSEKDFSILTLLLEAGADIRAKSGRANSSPLQEAILKRHVKLAQLFLNYETIDDPANELDVLDTALRKAARDGDFSLMRRLLDAKANLNALTQPSMITLLQDAVRWHDINTVQALLDVGADVDAPAGIAYEAARKAVVMPNDLRHLQSAIQIAADQGMTEKVIALLDAGANVDGYFLTQEEYSVYESIHYRLFEADLPYLLDDVYDDLCRMDIGQDSYTEYCKEICIYRPHFYWTPLQSAVDQMDFGLVWILLAAGADIEGQGLGLTPLQLAAMKDESRLVKFLLKRGAAVNAPARGFHGRTALQAAIENGNADIVEILMDAGSDLNTAASPKCGYTALQAAVKNNNIELVRKLISLGADVNAAASPINGRTCLQAAAENGVSELVQLLLNSGAEVNAAGAAKYGLTALQAAACGGRLSVVKMLLAAGADMHAPSTEGGYSAVSAAVVGDNPKIMQLFLKRTSPNGQADLIPPLFRASIRRRTEIVKCLIKAGVNVHTLRTDKPSLGYGYPCTALEAALERGYKDIVNILLDASACSKDQVPGLRAALGAASIRWRYKVEPIHIEIAQKLLSAGANVNRAFSDKGMPLHNAAYSGRTDLVQILLNAGADVNGRSPDGDTALLNAVRKGNIDMIKLLLNAGADIEIFAPMIGGRTALQGAAECGNTTVVRFLLAQGADCNARAADSKGVTALQAAAIMGHLPIALLLLEAGANINAPAAKISGRSALEAAAEHGRLDIAALLLKNNIDTDGLGNKCECAAKLAESNGHIFIAEMLRRCKID